jgi:hypothetical protein
MAKKNSVKLNPIEIVKRGTGRENTNFPEYNLLK